VSAESFHCVTCADEALPMRVESVAADGAAVCAGDIQVLTDLVGPVAEGDRLLVHAGVAIARLEA